MYVVMNSERVKELWEEKGCYARGRASEATRLAGFLRSLGRGNYSVPMVPGSEGSVGSGVSGSSSGGRSVSPGCPLLLSSRSTRAIRSCSCSSEASRSCWSESNC
jgi:hypothetical protein